MYEINPFPTALPTILAAILIARGCASALRALGEHVLLQLLAGLFLGVCGWFATALFQGWTPLWVALAAGSAIGLLQPAWRRVPGLAWAAEAALVLLLAVTSLTPVAIMAMIATATAIPSVGWIGDRLARRAPAPVHVAAIAGAVAIAVTSAELRGPLVSRLWESDPWFPLFCAVTLPYAGELVELPTGSVAWHLPARKRDDPLPVAVVMHGANSEGSHQPAAIALQRALHGLDIEVVSLDHPGFGRSPAPSTATSLSAWDPLPSIEAALRFAHDAVHDAGGPETTMAFGHSLGVTGALALAASGAPIDAVYLLGGAVVDGEPDDYWYERFHTDRGLSFRIPQRLWLEIGNRYYERRDLALQVAPNRYQAVFVKAEIEWPNIVAKRDALFAALPAPKSAVTLEGSTHYLSAFNLRRLIVADTRVTRQLMRIVRPVTNP